MTVTSNRESRVIVSASGFSNPIDLDQYVEEAAHLKVYADATLLDYGVEWTVAGLLDDTGVEVTITATGLANYSPTNWVVYHEPPVEQGANLSLGGRFGLAYEQALDATTRRNQSLEDRVNRGLRLPVDTPLDASVAELPSALPDSVFGWNADGTAIENKGTLPDVTGIAAITDEIVTVAGIGASVTTVAGIHANVTTVAGISAAVTTVAGISAAVSTVSGISAAVSTVSGIQANVTTVAGISAAVTTVAGISAAVSTVSGIQANVTTVAGLAASITTLAGISANITTVAGISADVTAVAGNATNINAVAANAANINAAVADLPSLAAKANTSGSNAVPGTFNQTLGAPLDSAIINGFGLVNQRTYTTVADDVYWCDRHYVLTQTAAITPTIQSNVADGLPAMMRLTQTQASAQRMGNATILEGKDTRALRGKLGTLAIHARASASLTIRYAILEWTSTEDSPTSDVVRDWTDGTFGAGNFFLSSNLVVRATGSAVLGAASALSLSVLTGTIGTSANNLIFMWWTDATAAQNVWVDAAWVFVSGDQTGMTRLPSPPMYDDELERCKRYFQKIPAASNITYYAASTSWRWGMPFKEMRVAPTGAAPGFTLNNITGTPTLTIFSNGYLYFTGTVTAAGGATITTDATGTLSSEL